MSELFTITRIVIVPLKTTKVAKINNFPRIVSRIPRIAFARKMKRIWVSVNISLIF